MLFSIFTLFPKVFETYLESSILGRALNNGYYNYKIIDIRNYSNEKHKKVDDIPFGGNLGMVMQPEVIANAIDFNCNLENTKFYYMSPRGKVFNSNKIQEILNFTNIAIICGRYEGIDQRVIDEYKMEEISIGDFVLSGGELPALTLMDACIRCIDGVLGNKNSINEDSFGGIEVNSKYKNLLEYPLYTQPRIWRNKEVPNVLLSGHHKNIEKWKLEKSEEITKERRPDLWHKYLKNKEIINNQE